MEPIRASDYHDLSRVADPRLSPDGDRLAFVRSEDDDPPRLFVVPTDVFPLVEWNFDATPWADHEFLWTASPVANAEAVDTPTLVMHADDDYRVPASNGELFYRFLRKQGVDTRFVRYPREGHQLSRSGEPGHVVDRLERIARWFDGYSAHHDAARALERGGEGLSASGDEGSAAAGEPDD